MFKGLKINIAVVICVAFLFRLFSLSLFVSSSNESIALTSVNASTLTKKGMIHVEPVENSKSIFTDVVFSEEDVDDENEHRSFTPILLESFNGLTLCCIGSHVKAVTPSNKHFACNSSQRRLEFGVFRI